ncbi:MAG: aminotransferase class IV [Actinomycetota bacterium]|nr:aminotransferase class IV [Actinomycetota bacterium]
MNLVYLNGVYLPKDEARISVLDRGLNYGDGVFTTIKVRSGMPILLPWHLERLIRDAAALYIEPPSAEELERACYGLISTLGIEECVLKIIVSRGVGGRGPSTKKVGAPTVIMTTSSLPEPRPPLSAISVPDNRSTLAAHKTLNYLPNVLALHQAGAAGCDEAIFVRDGLLIEATISNVIGVFDGVARTPALDGTVLGGIARRALLEAGTIEAGELPVDLQGPLYCVNSVRGVGEVAELDGRTLNRNPDLHKTLQETLLNQERLGSGSSQNHI